MIINEVDYEYDNLVREAIKDVATYALRKARRRKDGNFHLSFTINTNINGVKLPKFMKKGAPERITLIIRYKFKNLRIKEDNFSVDLDFYGETENIVIPFCSIITFSDQMTGIKVSLDDEDYYEDEEEYTDLEDEWDNFFHDCYPMGDNSIIANDIDNKNELIYFKDIKNKE